MQQTAAAVCLDFGMTLVNSYEDTMSQGHLVLRYKLFSCYNHGEYLNHSQDILVDKAKNERKKKKATFTTTHFCV